MCNLIPPRESRTASRKTHRVTGDEEGKTELERDKYETWLTCMFAKAAQQEDETLLLYLAHVDGERFRPAVEQFEEEEALACWDFIRVIDDEDVVWSGAHHPGHAVTRQEGTQVVVGDPAVLPSALWEVVEEHVQDLVAYVVIRTVEEEPQETGENRDIKGRVGAPGKSVL